MAPEGRLRAFAADALRALAEELPDHARALAELAPAPLEVQAGARFAIVRQGAVLCVEDDARERARVTLVVDEARVGALIAGETSVLEAVREGALDAYGAAGDLVAAERALHAFLEGAARSTRAYALFGRWREGA